MANPPGTIGEFDNVPQPGSPIRSDWPVEVSTAITNIRTKQVRHGWELRTTGQVFASGAGGGISFPIENLDTDGYHSGTLNTATIPSTWQGTYLLQAHCQISVAAAVGAADLTIQINSTLHAYAPVIIGKLYASVADVATLGTGDTVAVNVFNGTSSAQTFVVYLRGVWLTGL